MDEIVIRAMQRWPNVPAVYGWLQLDRRGQWLIKTREGNFERIANPAITGFFGRNYLADEHGRWYVQNGPQRVFVSLEYTPLVYVLDGTATGVSAHTGAAPSALRALFLDDQEQLLLETDIGVGVIHDRDLSALLDRLTTAGGDDIETALRTVSAGGTADVQLFGYALPLSSVRRDNVARRFGFVPRPAPAAGQPDCE